MDSPPDITIVKSIVSAAKGLLVIVILCLCGFLLAAMYGLLGPSSNGWSQGLNDMKSPSDTILMKRPSLRKNSLIQNVSATLDSVNNEVQMFSNATVVQYISNVGYIPPNHQTPSIKSSAEGSPESVSKGKKAAKGKNIQKEIDFSDSLDINELATTLEHKLQSVNTKFKKFRPTCDNKFKLANSCDKKCLQTELPVDIKARITQLVKPAKLQLTPEQRRALYNMADKVEGQFDIILLTAASSNHYLEAQALLENVHQNVFPHLKNFKMILYNLGLNERERAAMVKYCKCTVVDFPFELFPDFIRHLKCYSWKPVMIKAHMRKANLIMWMDASIRFHKQPYDLNRLIQMGRDRGVQIGGSSVESSFRTLRSMYHFFGDEPCAYLNLRQAKATFGIYKSEYFVERAILEPWVACALNENCICPPDRPFTGCFASKAMSQKYEFENGPIVYGLCHRYDQSAISLILHKLYQESFVWVMVNVDDFMKIRREHTTQYFPVK